MCSLLAGNIIVVLLIAVRLYFVSTNLYEDGGQGVREKARVFETLNFFGKGLTQIETDVQLL